MYELGVQCFSLLSQACDQSEEHASARYLGMSTQLVCPLSGHPLQTGMIVSLHLHLRIIDHDVDSKGWSISLRSADRKVRPPIVSSAIVRYQSGCSR